MKIYILNIWGHPHAFYSTKEKAEEAGFNMKEPTNSDGEYDYGEFDIEEWTEGEDTQYAKFWDYEYKIGPAETTA